MRVEIGKGLVVDSQLELVIRLHQKQHVMGDAETVLEVQTQS